MDLVNSANEVKPQQEKPKPRLSLIMSNDKMELTLELQREDDDVAPPEFEDIMGAIAQLGVVQGIKEDRILIMCQNPVYNQPVVIAQGVPPTTGKDGYVNYWIDVNRDLKPKIREDGTVDFRDLGYVQNVRKGKALCEIVEPEQGEDGFNIMGQVLPGIFGREARVPAGRNTELNEDKTLLLASCDGNIRIINGDIYVSDVLRISGNVDNSTGNIDFVGDVFVDGDVISGFTVNAGGNVVVKGSVEGATIKAKGNIMVSEGINGMNRGSLTADGNIRCRFIQSCFIKCEQNIYADSIMYCMIECGGDVELTGRRGTLIGGRASIGGGLSLKSMGTASHVATYVNMVANMILQQQVTELEQQIQQIDKDTTKLMQILNRFDDLHKQGRLSAEQAPQIQQVRDSYVQLRASRQGVQQQLERLQEKQMAESSVRSYIECTGRIHVGVQIAFGPIVMMIQQSYVYCRVSLSEGSISIAPLGPRTLRE